MTTYQLDVENQRRELDALQTEFNPLPAHFALQKNERSRELYFSGLLALIMAGNNMTESQQRVLKLLMQSLGLGRDLELALRQTEHMALEQWREFCQLVTDHDLTHSFFMDALVVCRLESGLTDAQRSLLSELVVLLQLPEMDLPSLISLADRVLNISTGKWPRLDVDFEKLSVWSGYLPKVVTLDSLRSGPLTGVWVINNELKADFPCSMKAATIIFAEKGKLNLNFNGEFTVEESRVWHPQIKIENASVSIKKTEFSGDYPEASTITAIEVIKGNGTSIFSEVEFKITEARALSLANVNVTIEKCRFLECGSTAIQGGAILFSAGSYEVKESVFEGCKAYKGGAVFIREHHSGSGFFESQFIKCHAVESGGGIHAEIIGKNSVVNCRFSECSAEADDYSWKIENWKDFSEKGSAIYGKEVHYSLSLLSDRAITGSHFFQSSIAIKAGSNGAGLVAVASHFVESPITYSACRFSDPITTGCGFDNRGRADMHRLP